MKITKSIPALGRSWARRAAHAALLGIPLMLAACGGGGGGSDPLVRKTHLGEVRGALAAGAFSWKGIPYAKPPTGELRWQAPQEPQAWTSARTATAARSSTTPRAR